jgi:hypothetical protein
MLSKRQPMNSSTQIKVFTMTAALAALESNPDNTLVVVKKKTDKRYKCDAYFLSVTWNIDTSRNAPGWFTATNITVTKGISDPNDLQDKRNEEPKKRSVIETRVSSAGDLGKFMLALNEAWIRKVQELADSKVIMIGKRRIADILQLKVSDNNSENPGVVIEDPIIRLRINFAPFPSNIGDKKLAGKPQTTIYDATTKMVDPKTGRITYNIAQIDEVPINESNMHLFITAGSRIEKMRLMIQSACVSQSFISMQILVNEAVIESGGNAEFDDAEYVVDPDLAEEISKYTPASGTITNNEGENNEDLEDLL